MLLLLDLLNDIESISVIMFRSLRLSWVLVKVSLASQGLPYCILVLRVYQTCFACMNMITVMLTLIIIGALEQTF